MKLSKCNLLNHKRNSIKKKMHLSILNLKLVPILILALSLSQGPIPVHATVTDVPSCFNLTSIRRAVGHSQIVFIGKIINLVETYSQSPISEKPTIPLFSETLTNPNSSQQFSYYHYNHVGPAKRRRHSSGSGFSHPNSSQPSNSNRNDIVKSYTGTVQVKTVFKGQKKYSSKSRSSDLNEGLEGRVISVKIDVHVNNDFLNASPPFKNGGRNSARFSCLRRLRILDTRIFFYNTNTIAFSPGNVDVDDDFIENVGAGNLVNGRRDGNKRNGETIDLIQTLMPLPPTLGILNSVRQAAKGRPLQLTLQNLKNLNLLKDEPCEQTYCAFGATCNIENGKATCNCPESCADGYAPVCGSDDVTYANECLLRKLACKNQKIIRIKRSGECGDKVDPCEKKACPFDSHCVASPTGESATCDCPAECPIHDTTDGDQLLCGSDGKQYTNECELNRHACLLGRTVTVKYLGKCDPCENVSCASPEVCQLDHERRATCRCGSVCSLEFHPVCASNGRTFTNECAMRQESCRTRTDLRIIYRGQCSSGVNPCESRSCKGYESCAINRYGVAQCVCGMVCDPIIQLVCGTDGITYDNYCQLTLSSCRESMMLEISHSGSCEASTPCTKHICFPGATCTEKNGLAICECSTCPSDDYEPICGSDGVTYPNSCQLRFKACTTNTTMLQIRHNGRCNSCETRQCDFYSICESDDFGSKCVCPQNCLDEKTTKVCGSDGLTYPNECELQKVACQQQRLISIESKGYCDLCTNVHCKFGAKCEAGICECPTSCPSKYEPVCASTLKTYPNECELQKAACKTERSTTVLFYGICLEDSLALTKNASTTCGESVNGCCPDGLTSALGFGWAGCPSQCQCNKLGSMSDTCDPVSQQCKCRSGIGGERCDRCLPGYWGFPRVVNSNANKGCEDCECSKFGSARDDCEQMTGHCVCKSGVFGHKCDSCGEGQGSPPGPNGCTAKGTTNSDGTCDQSACLYGSECQHISDRAECICSIQCDDQERVSQVCASDGFTYESSCLVQLQSCREQQPIWVILQVPCPDSTESDEADPARAQLQESALVRAKNPGSRNNLAKPEDPTGLGSSGMKSTRHLQPQLQSNFHDSFHKAFFSHRLITSTIVEMKSYLGDSCQSSSECVTTFSICLNGVCICKEGYLEDSERIQCRPIQSHAPKPIACTRFSSCHDSSTCLDHLNGTYSCVCPLGTVNHNDDGCTKQENPIPLFTGNSTISLGKLAGYHKLSIDIELTPYLDYEHGVIIFSSQYTNGSGDFMSLALIDGYVEFRYDLGDGPVILRSINRLQSGSTHIVTAKRFNRDGLLQVNDDEEVKGSSSGDSKSLKLDNGGYMGYVTLNSTKIWEIVGTSQGFIGCVHNLKIGRRPVDFVGTRDPLINSMVHVHQCSIGAKTSAYHHTTTTTPIYAMVELETKTEVPVVSLELYSYLSNSSVDTDTNVISTQSSSNGNPCSKTPCKNNGHCWSDKGHRKGFKCVCHPQYFGKLCDSKTTHIEETGTMLDFRGFSYLELPKIDNYARHISIEIWIMIRSLNGIILYNGQFPGKGDYIALQIVNGHVQFLFELGSGIGNLTSAKPISINKWHWISASRNGREGRLQVDGETPNLAKSPPTLSELNLELPLYLGGIRDINIIHRELGLLPPFDGVFQYMKVNGATYHREITNAIKERQVHKYEGPPCGSSVSAPCGNGGTCFPRLHSFTCLCPAAYTGTTCENRKDLPGPIRFNGQNFIKFPKKVVKRNKVQRRNRIEIVFRTSSKAPGVLIWIGRPHHDESRQRGYLGLFLVDGYLELRINLGAIKHKNPVVIRSKMKVTGGRWHQVLIERRRRFIVFQVDGSSPQRETAPVGSNVLRSDGRIWIGGISTAVLPGEVPSRYHQGFVGCVDLVRIEKKRLPLSKIAYATGNPFCDDENDD